MKKTLFAFIFLLAALTVTHAAVKWLENYDEAVQQAARQNKYLLILFTGSDWCGYCMEMERTVFPSREFAQYAQDNLVLLKLDFPRKRSLSARLTAQNQKLKSQYQVDGFPTTVILTAQGEKRATMSGYPSDGLPQFMEWLKQAAPPLPKADPNADKALAEAAPGTVWLNHYGEAARQAQADHRYLLIAFTGSDWCGPCQNMEQQVFASDTFREYAAQKLILLSVDFPRQKALPAALQTQNAQLAKQYKVDGYPTVIVLNDKGEELDRLVGGFKDALPGFMRWIKQVIPEPKSAEQQAKESDGWSTDYAAAAKKAKDTKRPLLVAFTGSDWCGPCQHMEKNVYATPVFKDFAQKRLVLMQADYPENAYQDKAVRAQNAQLEKTYQIDSFPTMILFDSQGKILARESGAFDTPESFVEWLKAALK